MDEYGMNEFEMIKKADVMRIINAENAVVLNNLKERSTDEVLCAIASQINGLQTIEAEPIRHGRWILCTDQSGVDNDNNNYAYFCSECHHQDVHSKFAKVNFCWNCGAKMQDGGAENG